MAGSSSAPSLRSTEKCSLTVSRICCWTYGERGCASTVMKMASPAAPWRVVAAGITTRTSGCVFAEPMSKAGMVRLPACLGSSPMAQTVFELALPLTRLIWRLDCVPRVLKSESSTLKSGWLALPPSTSTLRVTVSPICMVLRSSQARALSAASAEIGTINIKASIMQIRNFITALLRAGVFRTQAGTCGATSRPDHPAPVAAIG